MTRDCNHGQLARSCNICELEQEVTMLRQEYEADTSEIAKLNAMLDERRGEIDRLRRAARVYDAVSRACAELPELWNIRIDIERGAGTVSLINPDGDDVEFPSDHDYMSSSINDAINAAIEQGQADVPANP